VFLLVKLRLETQSRKWKKEKKKYCFICLFVLENTTVKIWLSSYSSVPTWGQFNSNYIIFRKMLKFSKKLLKEKKRESNEIFENISFVKIESSKLLNYLTNKCLKWPRYYGIIADWLWGYLISSDEKPEDHRVRFFFWVTPDRPELISFCWNWHKNQTLELVFC
jgi:hypothetical protein